ncbi:hypothetical protein BDZ97DRAFT_1656887 [Flammula alnicola]|nr:hypothetical protein BDZ97DRAFT_1656887 [Flammula alnicola]
MGKLVLHLVDLPMDVIYEILGHLAVEDIIRSRQVCRRLCQATCQRNVWISVYERSSLLLPEGPLPSQCSVELEASLVRAAKLHINWTSPRPLVFTQRRFPRVLPTYDFDANVISGRYLQLAERDGISWYDLDATDMSKPILTYPCPTVMPLSGNLNYQVNANGEGPDVVWVSFVSHAPSKIFILKANFGNMGPKVDLHAELSAQDVTSIEMGHDWLLPIREFASPDSFMDLFHIPSHSTLYLPMHEKVQNLSDLHNLNYAITPRFLFLMFSMRSETLVDMYPLPKFADTTTPPPTLSGRLIRSHSGIYPHAISTIRVVETSLDQRQPKWHTLPQDTHTSFLALVYVSRSPRTWTSKIGLHLFDVTVDSNGTLTFTTQSETVLNVGIATTSLALSARAGICLAVTHSSPGPLILAHRIQRHQDSKCSMSVKTLKPPDGLQSRDMLAFDGFRGRLCLINGWTNIDVLDYA